MSVCPWGKHGTLTTNGDVCIPGDYGLYNTPSVQDAIYNQQYYIQVYLGRSENSDPPQG